MFRGAVSGGGEICRLWKGRGFWFLLKEVAAGVAR